jgi:hypothetical protein
MSRTIKAIMRHMVRPATRSGRTDASEQTDCSRTAAAQTRTQAACGVHTTAAKRSHHT